MSISSKHEDSIAEIKSLILGELDDLFWLGDFSRVTPMIESIDHILLKKIHDAICSSLNIIFPHSKATEKLNQFEIAGVRYSIYLGENIPNFRQIDVAILDVTPLSPSESVNYMLPMPETHGRFSSISFTVSKKINPNKKYLSELCSGVISTIYSWATEYIRHALASEETSLARNLYTRLRAFYPNSNMWQSIWFGVVKKDEGFWILEDSVLDSLAKNLSKAVSGSRESTLRLLNEFLCVVMPYELMSARHVRDARKPLSFDIPKSDYAENMDLYAIAEQAVFASRRITIYPLYIKGNVTLFAVYSAKQNYNLNQLFLRHSDDFAKVFHNSKSRITRFRKQCDKLQRSFDYGKLGEIIGGLGKGFLG